MLSSRPCMNDSCDGRMVQVKHSIYQDKSCSVEYKCNKCGATTTQSFQNDGTNDHWAYMKVPH